MKSKTIWIFVVAILLIAIIYAIYRKQQRPTGGVINEARSTQQDYCERHGGSWNGTTCSYYTEPVTQRVIRVINTTTPVNPVNPAGNGIPK